MSVALSPAAPRTTSVGAAEDPYKKYWAAILAGFVLTGLWLCLPVMESGVGSSRVDAAKPVDAGGEQSLDAPQASALAPGTALDLSMDVKRKSLGGEDPGSMLYQAPGGDGSELKDGAPLAAAAAGGGASLAAELKAVGAKGADGWGGEKAQKGFDAPRLAGGSLSGLGGTSGGSGASASSSFGTSAFGASNASVGYSAAKGLRDDGAADRGSTGGGAAAALRNAASSARRSVASASNDSAAGGMSHLFDGAKKGGGIGDGLKGGAAGLYSALDAAPANLKLNPQTDKKKIKEPTPSVPTPSSGGGSQMGQQLAMMAATMVIGGLVPGAAGSMIMMVGMQAAQMVAQQQAQDRADERMREQQKNHPTPTITD